MKKYFIVSLLVVLSLVLTGVANAASTIGTNMSTTGTFLQTVGSATAAQFQNAAGDVSVLVVDTTNTRVGVGAAPSTTFEVQGTASASYFFTQNTIQVAGVPGATASVAWSRFGTGTATHTASTEINASNDVLITGALEVDGTTFLDGKASVSDNFETAGRINAGNASHSFTGGLDISKNLVVGANTASGSGIYVAEFVGATTSTVSILFGSSTASSKGTCFQFKDAAGVWVYARVLAGGTSFTINNTKCHQ